MQLNLFLICGLLFALANAMPSDKRVIMEPDVSIFAHNDWEKTDRVKSGEIVTLNFAIKHEQDKRQTLENELYDRSSPKSENYGKWLTIEQIAAIISPKEESTQEVVQFLRLSLPNAEISLNKFNDMIKVQVDAVEAERLLQTELYHFVPKDQENFSANAIRAVRSYSLPRHIAQYVSFVSGLIRLPRLGKKILKQKQ